MANINQFQIGRMDPRYVALDEKGRPADMRVQAAIKCMISEKTRQRQCGVLLNRTGWARIPNGKHIYVAGTDIVGEMSDTTYILSSELPDLSISDPLPDISDQRLIADYFRRLKRDPFVLVPLSSHMIRSLLASIFEELGYPMRFVLHLTGVRGSGKMTAANDFALPITNLSNHTPAPTSRALASKAAVRDFTAEYRDMPVLLDDVCTSSGSGTRRASTEVAAYTLRFVADRIPELLKLPGGKQRRVRCNAGVIITGEFPMTASSDLTRCVIVNVDHQMRGKEADNRAVTSAVALRFLRYVAANYDTICEKIRSGLGLV